MNKATKFLPLRGSCYCDKCGLEVKCSSFVEVSLQIQLNSSKPALRGDG